jgi:hypothetical protein
MPPRGGALIIGIDFLSILLVGNPSPILSLLDDAERVLAYARLTVSVPGFVTS